MGGVCAQVLIHAGSGGVGHFAIQIAKALGCVVVATSSSKNKDFVMSLGADEHIDYRAQAFEEVLSDIDFVLDPFGGENLEKCIGIVKKGGKIVSLPEPPSEEVMSKAEAAGVTVEFILVASNGANMQTLKGYLEDGTVKPHVSKTFSFAEMAESHAELESGRTVGKIIVTV